MNLKKLKPLDPIDELMDGMISNEENDYEMRYEILDSNGKSKSDREREQKKQKKKMTKTHRIV